jgi:uncharacterized damage-inducible protein DinB
MSFSKELLLDDLRFSAWSNQRLLDGCSIFSATDLERDFRISHTSILATLNHICDSERVWLDCLCSTPDGLWCQPTGPASQLQIPQLEQTWANIGHGLEQRIESLSTDGLRAVLPIQIPPGIKHFARWQILRHCLDHSIFHRGQIIGMIHTLGYVPPAINRMDYFLMKKEPGSKSSKNKDAFPSQG